MYGRLFASAFSGSMVGSGAAVFAVWAYIIAHCDDGEIELHPKLLAVVIGEPVEAIEEAIRALCAPDPKSRNPDHEGRRLLSTDVPFRYLVTSHDFYRAIRTAIDRREYNRRKQAESRARKRVNADVSTGQHFVTMSADQTQKQTQTQKQKKIKKPVPPDDDDPRLTARGLPEAPPSSPSVPDESSTIGALTAAIAAHPAFADLANPGTYAEQISGAEMTGSNRARLLAGVEAFGQLMVTDHATNGFWEPAASRARGLVAYAKAYRGEKRARGGGPSKAPRVQGGTSAELARVEACFAAARAERIAAGWDPDAPEVVDPNAPYECAI